MTSVRAGLSRFRQKAKVLRQELWCLSKHAGLLRFASNPSREREGFQNAGSARERSAVALSSLVAPLRGGAIYRVGLFIGLTRARARLPDRAELRNGLAAVRGFKMSVHAAARWYSWISPPRRSRRLMPPQVGGGWAFVESGESSASPR